MKNHLENDFISKFNLLNSQENSEEIIWSSDSSDYEHNTKIGNIKPDTLISCKKRKRVSNKRKVPKNVSNLDITFSDGSELEKNNKNSVNKPSKYLKNKSPKIECLSPILTSSQRHFVPLKAKDIDKSPIILSRSRSSILKENKSASPILQFKHISPINSPKVRKKLFNINCNNVTEHTINKTYRSKSPILRCTQNISPKSISCNTNSNYSRTLENEIKHVQHNMPSSKLIKDAPKPSKCLENLNISDEVNKEDVLTIKTSFPLIEKVKSYFESHFSSNTTSQSVSISECETEKNSSKSNDDIEIINSLPEKAVSNIIKLESKTSSDSWRSFEENVQRTKKVKYKKDGLSYRLSALLKKQNASTSLWLHERYLAANSNFVLPTEEFVVFRIQNVVFKFGSFLMKVVDNRDEKYLVLLNIMQVHDNNMGRDAILKVYKPFKIMDYRGCKLIINVYKYECSLLKK